MFDFQNIATYALCGFANPASIGIQLAGFTTLAPTRRADFSKCAIRAYVTGSLACFMTACIAGALIEWILLFVFNILFQSMINYFQLATFKNIC